MLPDRTRGENINMVFRFFTTKNVLAFVLKLTKLLKMLCAYCFKVPPKDPVMKNTGLSNI